MIPSAPGCVPLKAAYENVMLRPFAVESGASLTIIPLSDRWPGVSCNAPEPAASCGAFAPHAGIEVLGVEDVPAVKQAPAIASQVFAVDADSVKGSLSSVVVVPAVARRRRTAAPAAAALEPATAAVSCSAPCPLVSTGAFCPQAGIEDPGVPVVPAVKHALPLWSHAFGGVLGSEKASPGPAGVVAETGEAVGAGDADGIGDGDGDGMTVVAIVVTVSPMI